MRVKAFAFILPAVLLTLLAVPVYANGVPPLPHAFYGDVTINGSPAPAGTTTIEARVTGVLTGIEGNPITTAELGKYGSITSPELDLIVQGDITSGTEITFLVNGVDTGQTYPFQPGETTKLGLSVTIAVPRAGGGGAPPDTTAPAISGVCLCPEGVTETTADICWTTNEASTSQVEYRTSPSMLSPLDETMVFNHHVHLTDLTPGTTYHYKTMSRDAAGNLAVSDEDTFATLGVAPAAAFASSDLSVSPGEVSIGETVTITVSVTNTGDAAGSYKVTLRINGVVEATKEVTLDVGASEEVTFTTIKDVAGSYSVAVDGLGGSFTVKEEVVPAPPPPPPPPPVKPPINWPLIGGIIAAVVVVGLAVFFWVRRRAA